MTEGLNLDYTLFIPEFLLSGLAVLIVALDLYAPRMRKMWLSYVAAAGLAQKWKRNVRPRESDSERERDAGWCPGEDPRIPGGARKGL